MNLCEKINKRRNTFSPSVQGKAKYDGKFALLSVSSNWFRRRARGRLDFDSIVAKILVRATLEIDSVRCWNVKHGYRSRDGSVNGTRNAVTTTVARNVNIGTVAHGSTDNAILLGIVKLRGGALVAIWNGWGIATTRTQLNRGDWRLPGLLLLPIQRSRVLPLEWS